MVSSTISRLGSDLDAPHDYPDHYVEQQYLPDEIRDRKYYTYGDNKTEQAAAKYWSQIKDKEE